MKKKTTSLGMKLVAFLAMLMLFCIPAYAGVVEEAGEYEIYPTPQNVTYGDKEMQLTDQVKLTIGSGITLAGLCLFAWLGARILVIWLVQFTKWLAREIKGIFIKKGEH